MGIGNKIRIFIEEKKYDKQKLRNVLGYDENHFTALIEGRFIPGISDLLKLAEILETDIAALFSDFSKNDNHEKTAVKISPKDRIKIRNSRNFNYESLAFKYPDRKMEPFFVTLHRSDPTILDVSSCGGEEFLYIIEGQVVIMVGGKEYELKAEDSFYFNSTLPHSISASTSVARFIANMYKGKSIANLVQDQGMNAIIHATKSSERKNIVVVVPDDTTLSAINRAIDENIISRAFLVGDCRQLKKKYSDFLTHQNHYEFFHIPETDEKYELRAAQMGVAIIRENKAQLIMKGRLNTRAYVKAILDKKTGIGTGRRLSLVGIFEIPGIDRLIMLTDPGINPELFSDNTAESGLDIINNAIDVAKSLGISRPKIAILDANEIPTKTIPSTIYAKDLSERCWDKADVFGPLSYDVALYKDFAQKKGFFEHPVAGQADILVVPFIVSGNILYKSWVMTMGAKVANVVIGAQVPVILTSISDTDMVKFLTLCASTLYSNYLVSNTP